MPLRSHSLSIPFSSFTQSGWRRCICRHPLCVQYAAGRTPPHYSGHEGSRPSGGEWLWRDTIPGSLERLTAPEKGHDARLSWRRKRWQL